MCIQAAHWLFHDWKLFSSEDILQTRTRISIWPLHEPVLSSYNDRKEALRKRLDYNDKCPTSHDFQRKLKFSIPIHTWGEIYSIPPIIAKSKHFKRVQEIITDRGKYCLYLDETDPSKKSNWVYYCVMFDPTVSPEAADQGYIGETTRSLVERWKEHVGSKGGHSLVHYNLTLVNQYAQQRGKELSDFVAVFALGSTSKEIRKHIEGKLIRESLDADFSVANMKYGMNNKERAKKPDEEKISQNRRSISPSSSSSSCSSSSL